MSWGAVIGAVGNVAGGILGGKQSGGGGNKFQRRTQKRLVKEAMDTTPQVAALTPDQLAAMQGIRDMQGMGQAEYQTAMDRANALAGGVSAADIQKFYNPYEDQVIQSFLADLSQMRGEQNASVSSAAERAGAFGGDREAVYRAAIQGDLDRTGASTLAGLRSGGFNTALNAALQNNALSLAGNSQFANLIDSKRGANASDLNALFASGGFLQNQDQRVLDIPINTLKFRSEMNNPDNWSESTRGSTQQDQVTGALQGFSSGGDMLGGLLKGFGFGG